MRNSSPFQSRYVLLVTESSHVARTIRRTIRESSADPEYESIELQWLGTLSATIERLKKEKSSVQAILLDLTLPDSHGVHTFKLVADNAGEVPILVLSDSEEDLAKECVRLGAHHYLPKHRLDSQSLTREIYSTRAANAAEILARNTELAGDTLNSIGDAVLSTDVGGNVTYLNSVAEQMTGWRLQEALGKPLAEVFRIVDRETRQTGQNPLAYAIQQDQTVGLAADSVLIRRDGFEMAIEDSAAPIRDSEGQLKGAVLVFRDVGKANALAHKMSHVAKHDSLTELPNRATFDDRLGQAIKMEVRHCQKLAVLFIDLDDFKSINDTYGHTIGDAVLRAVAKLLCEVLRDEDTVSRYGGDEFLVLLPKVDGPRDAATVASKILLRLAAPVTIDGQVVHLKTSIGISVYPDHGQDGAALIRAADLAMYEAKKGGGNCYCLCPLKG